MLALTHLSHALLRRRGARRGTRGLPATEVPRDFDTIEVPFPERGPASLIRWSERLAAAGAGGQRSGAPRRWCSQALARTRPARAHWGRSSGQARARGGGIVVDNSMSLPISPSTEIPSGERSMSVARARSFSPTAGGSAASRRPPARPARWSGCPPRRARAWREDRRAGRLRNARVRGGVGAGGGSRTAAPVARLLRSTRPSA